MNAKVYFGLMIILMFFPQVILGVLYNDHTGDLYAIGYLAGMAALQLSQYLERK